MLSRSYSDLPYIDGFSPTQQPNSEENTECETCVSPLTPPVTLLVTPSLTPPVTPAPEVVHGDDAVTSWTVNESEQEIRKQQYSSLEDLLDDILQSDSAVPSGDNTVQEATYTRDITVQHVPGESSPRSPTALQKVRALFRHDSSDEETKETSRHKETEPQFILPSQVKCKTKLFSKVRGGSKKEESKESLSLSGSPINSKNPAKVQLKKTKKMKRKKRRSSFMGSIFSCSGDADEVDKADVPYGIAEEKTQCRRSQCRRSLMLIMAPTAKGKKMDYEKDKQARVKQYEEFCEQHPGFCDSERIFTYTINNRTELQNSVTNFIQKDAASSVFAMIIINGHGNSKGLCLSEETPVPLNDVIDLVLAKLFPFSISMASRHH